jgi:hypothetical protein
MNSGQSAGGPQQGLQRHGVPPDGLTVHDGTAGRAAVDDARHTHADPEEAARRDVRVVQHVGQRAADVTDDPLDVVAVPGEGPLGAGELGQREVEQLHAYAGLPHVDTDQVRAAARDAQEGTGAATVGVDRAGLLQQPVRGQLGDHVADRAGTQAGRRRELLPAERTVEVELAQHGRAVGTPKVTYGALLPITHPGNPPRSQSRNLPAPLLTRIFRHVLTHNLN